MLEILGSVWWLLMLCCIAAVLFLWPLMLFYVTRSIVRDVRRTADALERIAPAFEAPRPIAAPGPQPVPPAPPRTIPLSQFGR
jgi:hypothetical protein